MSSSDPPTHQNPIRATFEAVSGGYDDPALRFFAESARHLAGRLELHGDEHVLDVATGTGNVALLLAGRLPSGRVTGVDFSAGMLAQARKKAEARGLCNAEFVEMDMQELAFPPNSFDAAVCSFGIFFVPDMDAQLARIARVVKPGGTIAIANFHETYFNPLREMMIQRLVRMGVQLPPQTWRGIATETACHDFFSRAGLRDVTVELLNAGYFLVSAEQWWDVIWNAGFRRPLMQLPEQELAQFRSEHLREVEQLRTPEGIWLDVKVLHTTGTKAGLG